jgi:peptidoglycan/LPS O-acetylase OafA/YrhL
VIRTALLARPTTLGKRLGHGADNSLLLRHLAAVLVIYGHAYALASTQPGEGDFLSRLVPGFYAGSIGVCMFFALSGCLIARSWLRRPNLFRFAQARFLRIYPAYLICLLLCLGLFGPLFSDLAMADYFVHEQTRDYLARNVDLVGLAYTLPDVFARNPIPGVVNGSLWSLALEARLYLAIALLGVSRILADSRLFGLLVVAYAAFDIWRWLAIAPDHQDKAALTLLFSSAALAATHANRVLLSTLGLIAMGLLCWATHASFAYVPVTMLTIGYFSFWFCWRIPVLHLPWRGDYSYGLFLYGFPVQQMIVAIHPAISALQLTLFAVPSTLLFAIASWHWLEQPLLRLKQSAPLQPDPTSNP